MSNLSIYNVRVTMESQEQCDRMRKLCIDNELPIWDDFSFVHGLKRLTYQHFYFDDSDFCNWLYIEEGFTEVTEEEFIELLKQEKNNGTI